MLVRKFFYRWLWVAPVALAIWPIFGWLVLSRQGWEFLGLIIASPTIFVAHGIVSLLISMRISVRTARAVSWWDVGILAVWAASIIGFGIFNDLVWTFMSLGILIGIGGFWVSIWQFVTEIRDRARESMAEYRRMATPPADAPGGKPAPDWQGEMLVIEEKPDEPQR